MLALACRAGEADVVFKVALVFVESVAVLCPLQGIRGGRRSG